MKNLKLMSVMKHLSVAALGTLLALGVVFVSKVNVKAQTPTYENGVLTLSGEVERFANGTLLPTGKYPDNVTSVVIQPNTSLPSDSSYLFSNFSEITELDLSNIKNSQNITNMNSIFGDCTKLKSIKFPSDFNTSNVTNMSYMFNNCSELESIDVSTFNTSSVTNMDGMFSQCSKITELDLSNFNTSNVTGMLEMFAQSSILEKIIVGNGWVINNGTDCYSMFQSCFKLVGEKGTKFDLNLDDGRMARIDGGTETTKGYLSSKADTIQVFASLSFDEKFTLEICFPYDGTSTYNVTYGSDSITPYVSTIDSKQYFCFNEKVAAKELNDLKELIIKKNGTVVYDRYVSSATYLLKLFNTTTDAKTKKIAGSLMRYGAAAQVFFGHNTDYLANEKAGKYSNFDPTSYDVIIPGKPAFDATNINNLLENCNVTYAGMNLSLDEDIRFMMAFKLPAEACGDKWNSWSDKELLIEQINITSNWDLSSDYFILDNSKKYVLVNIEGINYAQINDSMFKSTYYGVNVSPVTYLCLAAHNENSSAELQNVCMSLYELYYNINY